MSAWLSVATATFLFAQTWAQPVERNAVYATQLAFETSTPIIYTTTGICIESAVKVKARIQVFLPQMQDIFAYEFLGVAKNFAFIIQFWEPRPAYASSPTGFTIDTANVSDDQLSRGISYNVTVADVSVGVRYEVASASCHFKLGYA